MHSRLVLAVAGWLLAAALATGAGVAVLGLLGRPPGGPAERPMAAEEIRLALARATPLPDASGAPAPGGSPDGSSDGSTADSSGGQGEPSAAAPPDASSPARSPGTRTPDTRTSDTRAPETRTRGAEPAAARKLISTGAGSVIARCDGGLARLQSWTPAQGFRVDDVDPGPDDRARVRFESDEGKLEIEVRCPGGVPTPRISRHG
ncbi:hypothetical protein AB0C10_30835 [Microbispora amethystogenes]|uniref:hypothetical protein n=1 Tax=Microbispora amethystogenes TaxID=1427754 RepID=UPI0033C3EE1B